MCNEQRFSESGARLTPNRCADYITLASDRDRLAGVVAGMEEQNARNLDAMRRANVRGGEREADNVMRITALKKQVSLLTKERDALKARLAGTVYDGAEATLPAYGQAVSLVHRESFMVQTFPLPGRFIGGKWYVIDRGVETVIIEPKIGDRWWPMPGGGE